MYDESGRGYRARGMCGAGVSREIEGAGELVTDSLQVSGLQMRTSVVFWRHALVPFPFLAEGDWIGQANLTPGLAIGRAVCWGARPSYFLVNVTYKPASELPPHRHHPTIDRTLREIHSKRARGPMTL